MDGRTAIPRDRDTAWDDDGGPNAEDLVPRKSEAA
jgi:hypothetical protein